jgi:hypothetical protein
MEPLRTYLRETRTTPKAFAKLIGVDAGRLERMLAGGEAIAPALARRMVDATGGALLIEDLSGEAPGAGVVIDLRERFAGQGAEIDATRLTEILSPLMPALIGGSRRKGDDRLPGLAAEAAANTYAALATVTSRSGSDRLVQALRPVFSEILEELSAPRAARQRIAQMARKAAELYFLGQR